MKTTDMDTGKPVPEQQPTAQAPPVAAEPMLQFFAYEHLPPPLRQTSQIFHVLATTIATQLPRNPERTVALRKLLEAKDCAVRTLLYKS